MENGSPADPASATLVSLRHRGPDEGHARASVSGQRAVILRLLIDTGTHMDIAQVAGVVGGHPNTARVHLERLVEAQLASRTTVATGRRGRPRVTYEATLRGRLAVQPTGVAQLVAAFAHHLATSEQAPAQALAVGRTWGSMLAANTNAEADAVDTVVTLLEHAGFSPRRDQHPSKVTIALRSCPVVQAARQHPEVVCEAHRGMVIGALSAAGQPTARVALQPFAETGACRLRLRMTTSREGQDMR